MSGWGEMDWVVEGGDRDLVSYVTEDEGLRRDQVDQRLREEET